MTVYGKTRPIRRALEKLAASSWGEQGIGSCQNSNLRQSLLAVGLVKRVKNEPNEHIVALTLKGFRVLEALRWTQKIHEAGRLRRTKVSR